MNSEDTRTRGALRLATTWIVASCFWACAPSATQDAVSLDPERWRTDYDAYLAQQLEVRSSAGVAQGSQGAVTVAYNALAARAGQEALLQGGNAIDAALTAALSQVALTAGAPISYFGILSLVYYDAQSGEVHTMNAEWNTVLGEDSPGTIPGGVDMSDAENGLLGRDPSGRTALVGGFMKGVGAAHERFGRLPFAEIFAPAIHIAEEGFPISQGMAGYWDMRRDDLARLPDTAKALLKPDGSGYAEGEIFRQPALAETLRQVVEQGVGYMYEGPWAERLVAAVQADGGKMTLEDLAAYEVQWNEPLRAELAHGYSVYTQAPPNRGGVALVEAQKLLLASGLLEDGHWSESAASLRKALDVAQLYVLDFLPQPMRENLYPGVSFADADRLTQENADKLWQLVQEGRGIGGWEPRPPQHSDDVVAIDADCNIAAITHSINCVLWGKTAIVVDGVTIGDPASFQQAQITRAGPGKRLESPTETGILFKDGQPVLGFASMGSGLHHRTLQGLANVIHFGMSVDEAIDAPDFFMSRTNPATFKTTAVLPAGRFPKGVLDELDVAWDEVDKARFGGEGIWVAIERDPETGELTAASHNRNNSAAVAH
ncbi:MAG: gamma-glutamyltransferase [Acidobacteriota bacterium]